MSFNLLLAILFVFALLFALGILVGMVIGYRVKASRVLSQPTVQEMTVMWQKGAER